MVGRLFISSVGSAGHAALVGPIRISTDYADVVTEVLQQEPVTVDFPYQINFQNATTTPPAGNLADYGQAYALQPSGLSYGWTKLSDGTPLI